MKLLIDMNLTPRWVAWLVERGHAAEHWCSVGPANAADAILMDRAIVDGAVVLTSDLDFGALLASSGDAGPSVILVRAQVLTPERIGAAVLECLSRFRSELEAGAIAVLDERRQKLRLLPLRQRSS